MNEQRDIWAARKKAAEEAQKTAETRELKTLALAYKNAREVASYFHAYTDTANRIDVSVTMVSNHNNGGRSDVVNKLLRSVIPKNAELADYIWEEAVLAVKEAKEDTAELLVQNLRTFEADMPSDLG